MTERFAIYYAPAADHPLWARAAEWLGRDPLTGATSDSAVAGLERERLIPLTASARRYGFHATLKPPMELAEGVSGEDLAAAVAAFAAAESPLPIGQLRLVSIDGFLALVPQFQGLALTGFAGRVVERLDHLRAPLSTTERVRRLAGAPLSPRQIDLLDLYGYPYVMEQFKFHLTVTDRLDAADRPALEDAAGQWFAADIGAELVIDRLVLFHEAEPGAPFVRGTEFQLGTR
jgi:putative phosphonate metabolism protein